MEFKWDVETRKALLDLYTRQKGTYMGPLDAFDRGKAIQQAANLFSLLKAPNPDTPGDAVSTQKIAECLENEACRELTRLLGLKL